MKRPWCDVVELAAGTSTGSMLSASAAVRLRAEERHALYVNLGPRIFKRTLRFLWPCSRCRSSNRTLISGLRGRLGELRMDDLWKRRLPFDSVITVRDLVENRTLFVRTWKREVADQEVWYAALCLPFSPWSMAAARRPCSQPRLRPALPCRTALE